MRRWLRPILPVAAIALWLQVLAPVMACQAVASIAADPLTFAELCRASHAGDRPAAVERAPGPLSSDPASSSDHACCAFCAASHGGALPVDPARDGVVMLWQSGIKQQWLSAQPSSSRGDDRSANRARAPPSALA
jgi:hypothetical protein